MDILYLLIPLSALLVLGIMAAFAWALWGGQFDDLKQAGDAILEDDATAPATPPASGPVDPRQGP